MTEDGLDIQTISKKQTAKQADRVLLLRQVIIEKEKADPPHFLKFLLARHANGTPARPAGRIGFAPTAQADPTQNQKSRFLPTQ